MFVTDDVNVLTFNGKDLNRFVKDAVYIDVPTNITGKHAFSFEILFSKFKKNTQW